MAGPASGALGHFIEPFQIFQAGDHFIVVAADYGVAMFTSPIQNFSGLRVVSHQVTATDDLIVLARNICQYSFQGVPIRMRIAENQELHKRIVTAA